MESRNTDCFRVALLIVTVLAWSLLIWMATHQSEQASIFAYSTVYFTMLIVPVAVALAITIFQWSSLLLAAGTC